MSQSTVERPSSNGARSTAVSVRHDAATGTDLHYRDTTYIGFTTPVGAEHSASRFDANRGSHIHLGFFASAMAASTALTSRR
jgi:hypothetical protein